ncbi:MAG TPA: LuxR C-terminal-related transcriptional regulator [Bacteroidota bacterium]|nr:LuxR C-terminal-related transcriptional regulator [Bacteroidota bacterium]
MKLLTANMKMADVVHSNYLLMPVISRFGIPLGFGENTVKAVCREHGIDVEFFLAIANAFSSEHYFPEKKLQAFNVLMIVAYLQKTHKYYIETEVPLIERLLREFIQHHSADKKNLTLIKTFFLEYKKELLAHLDREETTTFPYIKQVYHLFHERHATREERKALSRYSMKVYEEEHSDIDAKLYDLKNILIKYVHGDEMHEVYNEIIFELFRLEKDIQDHTRIENTILMPLVGEMESELFHAPRKKTAAMQSIEHLEPPPTRMPAATLQAQIAATGFRNQEVLTERETEVLRLVACGDLNKQIADKLSISLHTVISHRKNITRKLQIKTVAGLTIYALLNGLISSRDIS